jgi:hypothetical protein
LGAGWWTSSGDFLPPSPPAEKATTCQDKAGQSCTGDGPGTATCETLHSWMYLRNEARFRKFPDNRENRGNFSLFELRFAVDPLNRPADSNTCGQIPYAAEQGIF